MGFLDKVKGAVATAKDELDKAGVLDQLRANDDPPLHAPPDQMELTYMVDAIRRGALDPGTLISLPEVAAIAGRDVELPKAGFNEDFVTASFDSNGKGGFQRYSLSVCHANDDDYQWDADEHWAYVREHIGEDELVAISGLGDEAFRQDAYVWVKAHGRVFFTDVTGDRLDDQDKVVRAEKMARIVAGRV